MPNNVYIGSRYVPIFDGSWDNTKSYESLTIVEYGNNTYTSKKPVPVGTLPTDTSYWALTGNYNGQISNLQQQINDMNDGTVPGSLQEQIDTNTSDIQALSNKVDDVIVDLSKYGITGSGDETAKFDLLLADLESNHHYIFPNTEITVAFMSTVRYVNASNIIIDGLNLNGTANTHKDPTATSYSTAGICFNGNNIKIVNCQFKNIYQCLLIGTVNGINIDNCNFITCGYSILQMRNVASNNGIISNCRFDDNTNDAIELNCDNAKSYNWIIKGNICTGYADFPTAGTEKRFCGVTNVNHVVITDNIAYNIDGDSIVHIENDAQDIIISNNNFGEFVGLAAILIAANTALSQSPRKVLITNNMFKSSANDGVYRKFIQANSTINDVKVVGCSFVTSLPYALMGVVSGELNNEFVNCVFDMPNFDGPVPKAQFCKFNIHGENDLTNGHYRNNIFNTSISPSIKRIAQSGTARPWGYSTFMDNIANHAFVIKDAFHSVIKNNYVSTDGETNDFGGVNITPTSTSTIEDNYIGGK